MKIYFDGSLSIEKLKIELSNSNHMWLMLKCSQQSYHGYSSNNGDYIKIGIEDEKIANFLFDNKVFIKFYIIGNFYKRYSFLYYDEKITKTTMAETLKFYAASVALRTNKRTYAKYKLKFT